MPDALRALPLFAGTSTWRRRRLVDRRAQPLYLIAAIALLVCAVAVMSGRFTLDPVMAADLGLPVAIFLGLILMTRWSGFARLASCCEAILVSMTVTFVMTLCAAILASAGLPMADNVLASADALLFGIDRPVLTRFIADHGWFAAASRWIYLSFAVTPPLLLMLLFAFRDQRDGWTVTTAMMLALAATIALSWLLPAYGVPPHAYHFVDVLDGVRSGAMRRLDHSIVTGIVTFPSLHAADAVVLAWGYAKLGRAARPLVWLNVLMVGSAVVTGGHYLVDVVAGIAVAAASIRVACRLQDRLATPSSPRSAS